jgi:hypothetical protein
MSRARYIREQILQERHAAVVKVERRLKFDLLEAKSQGKWCARDLRRKWRTLAAAAS